LIDREPRCLEVNVRPTQSEDFTSAHPRCDANQDGEIKRTRFPEECRNLGLAQNRNLSPWRPWGLHLLSGIFKEDASLHCMSKGLRKGPVNVQDRPRCQALARLPAFHISIALQLCFKRLDVNCRKLLHRDFANPWHNLARDNLAMSPRSLVRNPHKTTLA
jgi:hypothetical protein